MIPITFFALVCGVFGISALEWRASTGIQRLRRQTAGEGGCVLPGPLQNGRFMANDWICHPGNQTPACQMTPGVNVPSHWILHFTCNDGYVLSKNHRVAVCSQGRWYPPLPVCNRHSEAPNQLGNSTATGDSTPQHINNTITVSLKPELVIRKSIQKCRDFAKSIYKSQGNAGETGTCRISNGRINDTKDPEHHELSHLAEFGYKKPTRWGCLGSLISERFVITTVHCGNQFGQIPSKVIFGVYDKSSTNYDDNNGSRPIEYDIADIIFHPEYDGDSLNSGHINDIVLVKLKENVIFNEFVRPICLHTEDTPVKSPALVTIIPETSVISDFTHLLPGKKIEATIVNSESCFRQYDSPEVKTNFSKSMLCVNPNRSDCGMIHYNGAQLQLPLQEPLCMYGLVGMFHKVHSYADCDSPNHFTRVSRHVQWIESIVWP